MSNVAKSLFCSGIYLIFMGITLIVFPTYRTIALLWVRASGILLGLLGYYYIQTARNEGGMARFFRWTIFVRLPIIVLLIVFGVLNLANPVIVVLGSIDLLAATWTVIALLSSGTEI